MNRLHLLKRGGLRGHLVRGGLAVGGMQASALLFGLSVSVLLARVLGPEGFGQYAFVITVATMLALPFGGGMMQLVTRQVAEYHHGGQWALLQGIMSRTSLWAGLGAFFAACILGGWAATRATWSYLDPPTLLILGMFCVPFIALIGQRAGVLRGLGNIVAAQAPNLLVRSACLVLVLLMLLALEALTAATALTAYAVSAALAAVVGSYLLRRAMPKIPAATVSVYQDAKWVRAWGSFVVIATAGTLNNQIGLLLTGVLSTNAAVGALRIATQIASVIVFSLVIVNMIISPYITRAYRDKDHRRLQALSRKSARVACLVALPVALCLIIFSESIIRLIFGSEYVAITAAPLVVLACAQLINVAFGSVDFLLSMTGHEKEAVNCWLFALFVNISMSILLIPSFGAIGAAYGSLLGTLLGKSLFSVRVYALLKIRPFVL